MNLIDTVCAKVLYRFRLGSQASYGRHITELFEVIDSFILNFSPRQYNDPGISPRKGENCQLGVDLNSEYRHKRKDAIKRIIASMTVGKDVSSLFPDALKNMKTDDLEQKKLVYLYLMNYAKTQPEPVILAVNTFVKDSEDPTPLVQALAIRTMGCLRLRAERIIDYLFPFSGRKLSLVIDNSFLSHPHEMILDSNPMVVANTVAALTDIHTTASTAHPPVSPSDPAIFNVTSNILNKLHIALNEYTEWGHVAILNVLAWYVSQDEKESKHICEQVVPQFSYSFEKMAPPPVTFLSFPPEVQWVALQKINLLLQKRPDLLSNEMRVFFCKYNDPLYVKVEKLDIMVRLANDNNVDALLSELKEYASEVVVDFVRKSIEAIGQTAISIESSAEHCVNVLLDLISTRISYVVQEAVVVMKDIFRKYPSTYEGVTPILCVNLEELGELEAEASLIWISGEYAEKINSADELSIFVELQTLTAVVKLFLKKPDSSQGVVQRTDSPDVRDRAYVYWRLLSTDPEPTIPPISIPPTTVSPALLEEFLGGVSSLESVYHKPAETFIGHGRIGVDSVQRKGSELSDNQAFARKAFRTVVAGHQAENLLDFDDMPAQEGPSGLAATQILPSSPATANFRGHL
ncbi:armadillo-type protein [Scleroderma citrinum]